VTDENKRMNPLHFGSDPTDIWTQIWINPEIRIRIPDHFWLRFCPWRRFALSEHSLVWTCNKMGSERLPLRVIHCHVMGTRSRRRWPEMWLDCHRRSDESHNKHQTDQ